MSLVPRVPHESPDQLPRELLELRDRIATLSEDVRRELDVPFRRVVDSVRRRRRIMGLVQESLAQLRLDIKYLLFDLEVTRRERDALRDS